MPTMTRGKRRLRSGEKQIKGYKKFQGTLGKSAAQLAACLKFDCKFDRLAERLGTYAFLKTSEDNADGTYQRMMGRFQHAASEASQAASYIRPEILAIPSTKFKKMLASKELKPYQLMLDRLVRYKPHTLSDSEERLLAMQSQMADTSSHTFDQLTDADLKFGMIKNEQGETIELSHSSFSALLHSPKRAVRKAAFHQYYEVFQAHENTLAATLSGSVQRDVYYAKARGYDSALHKALFADNVPQSVYDNLISAVRGRQPAIMRYLDLRRRKMKLKDIHHYDTYVPILSDLDQRRTWNQAVKAVMQSLEPLGDDYCRTLHAGLTSERWCDRYPNRGKSSGAFSCGTFDGAPYILMNYQPTVLDHVFTLTHEAGHSMHSYYSSKSQPLPILRLRDLRRGSCQHVQRATARPSPDGACQVRRGAGLSDQPRYRRDSRHHHSPDDVRGVRKNCARNWPSRANRSPSIASRLSTANCWSITSAPSFVIDEQLKLECLRIPHFYRAFYVYKYATGLSAAIALSERVLNGGSSELNDYLSFLKGGCSKYPLDLLARTRVSIWRNLRRSRRLWIGSSPWSINSTSCSRRAAIEPAEFT